MININKKAQVSSFLTWFVAFGVIIFIMFIFMAFSLGNFAIRAVEHRGGATAIIDENEYISFSEQQRGMFVLFESEFEGNKIYDSVENFVMGIENRNRDPGERKRTELNETLSNLAKEVLKESCFEIKIEGLEEQSRIQSGGGAFRTWKNLHVYFHYPSGKYERVEINVGPQMVSQIQTGLEYRYGFFFPEKDFALIKYLPKECENE